MTAVAAGLRCYELGEAGLWVDEINTVVASSHLSWVHPSKSFGYVATGLALRSFGVPLNEVTGENIDRWRSLGVTEIAMRFAACLIGIATIPLVSLVSRRIIGARAAVILALLLAVSPWHLWMSQSARFYSQQFLFSSLCLVWYFDATARSSRWRMFAAMACLVLAFGSQPPALVIVGVLAGDWLFGSVLKEPIRLGRFGWAAAVTAGLICFGALGIDVPRNVEGWTQFIDARAQSPKVLLLGSIWMIGPVTALFAAASAWWLWSTRRRLAVYLLLAAVVPIVAMVAISFKNFVHFRYMFVCLFGWLALAALGGEQIARIAQPHVGRILAYAPVAVLVTSAMVVNYGYFTEGYGFRNRWPEAFDYVQQHRQPGDAVCSGRKAQYYLEEPGIHSLAQMSSCNDLGAIGRATWIVYRAASPADRRRFEWVAQCAELKAYFDTRVLQPYSSIRVYYYDPDRQN